MAQPRHGGGRVGEEGDAVALGVQRDGPRPASSSWGTGGTSLGAAAVPEQLEEDVLLQGGEQHLGPQG